METFSALPTLCAGNSPVTDEFPSQRPVTWSFDVFFDLGLNKRLSKHSKRRWFETPSRSVWRHCNDMILLGAALKSVHIQLILTLKSGLAKYPPTAQVTLFY